MKPEHLLKQRTKTAERLGDVSQILRGTLLERMTRCNKSGCRCMRGEKHGPAYYVTVTYGKGKTRQIYVSKERKGVVEAWIANYYRVWKVLEEISRVNLELLRLGVEAGVKRPSGRKAAKGARGKD